jgi:predicted signal transduction protein with EAL and GGDEF domain
MADNKGIRLFPEDGQDEERLVQSADTEAYRPKQSGGNDIRFFDQQMKAQRLSVPQL